MFLGRESTQESSGHANAKPHRHADQQRPAGMILAYQPQRIDRKRIASQRGVALVGRGIRVVSSRGVMIGRRGSNGLDRRLS